jgi:hypothetical protein
MILAAFVASSLVVPVSLGSEPPMLAPGVAVSDEQKNETVRPLVSSATDCIARTVSADPRLPASTGAALNDLIVDSVRACVAPLRSMIDGYDHVFGDGAGETYFNGPYLDGLPAAVTKRIRTIR